MRPLAIPTDPEALLSEIQAADFLNLSIRTLQAWRAQGRGPSFVHAGRSIRYRLADLHSWISANTIDPKKPAARREYRSATTAA